MINDTLEFLVVEETGEKPEIYATVRVEAKRDDDLACAKCVGECKVY